MVERLLVFVAQPLDLIRRQLNLLAHTLHDSQAASPLNPHPSWGAVLHRVPGHQESQSPLSTSAECRNVGRASQIEQILVCALACKGCEPDHSVRARSMVNWANTLTGACNASCLARLRLLVPSGDARAEEPPPSQSPRSSFRRCRVLHMEVRHATIEPTPNLLPWLRTGHAGASAPRRVALLVVAAAVLFGCGATTNVVSQEGGGNRPPPPLHGFSGFPGYGQLTHHHVGSATATKAPTPPKIAGSYGGRYTSNSK